MSEGTIFLPILTNFFLTVEKFGKLSHTISRIRKFCMWFMTPCIVNRKSELKKTKKNFDA